MAVDRWYLTGFYDTSTHFRSFYCIVELSVTDISITEFTFDGSWTPKSSRKTRICQIPVRSVQKITLDDKRRLCVHLPLRHSNEEATDSQTPGGEEQKIFMDFWGRPERTAFLGAVAQMGGRYNTTISDLKDMDSILIQAHSKAELNRRSTMKRKTEDREAEELPGSKRRFITPARPGDLIDSSGRQPPNNSQKEQATSQSCANDDNGPLSVDKTTNGGEHPLPSKETDTVNGTEITDQRTSSKPSRTLRLKANEDNAVEHHIRELQGHFASRGQQVQALTKEVERLTSHDEQLQQEMVENRERAATFERQCHDLRKQLDNHQGCEPGMDKKLDSMKRNLDRTTEELKSLQAQQKESALQLEEAQGNEIAAKERERNSALESGKIRRKLDKTKAQNQGLQKDLTMVKDLLKICNPILALDVEKCVQLVRDGEKPQQALYKASGAFSG